MFFGIDDNSQNYLNDNHFPLEVVFCKNMITFCLILFHKNTVSSRHPVRHCRFSEEKLVIGNVPVSKFPVVDEFENSTHRR